MGILSYFRRQPYEPHNPLASPTTQSTSRRDRLRDALLKCATLSEDEVDEYLKYLYDGVVYESVPLDYSLDHPEADLSYEYADGILQALTLERHTNQISQETLEKVRRVLPLLYLQF